MKKLLFVLTLFLIISAVACAQVTVSTYSNPTLAKGGLFGKSEKINEVKIDSLKKINQLNNLEFKFVEQIPVNISPLNQGSKEIINDNIIFRQKIIAQNATSIKISFDTLLLSKNAILYIYNPQGSIITGPITSKENIAKGRLWSSNTFNDSAIILELKVPKSEESRNSLHISKILSGLQKTNLNPTDSTGIGHFNSSSPCNINVLCSQGNPWINERKAICLIETDDGSACSGALLTNTCNTNNPYVLTAWHCTNGKNPNNWTYSFGWWSTTCTPNTNNQTYLLFNGATLRATYEPTDFSLLELFQTPSSASDLTYLGWSRSSSIPSTSIGIHHPMDDQMKICFANSPAIIGDVRLNHNTAWRVLWNSGTTEKGSSGSPLFNQDHRVVGQNFSETQPTYPPCNQQTGGNNYGRFDLSWTGGGTNSTRLSNWLDPGNTGAMSTNTTNIASLVAPIGFLSMAGSDGVCSGTSQYTFKNNGVPLTGNITWTSSNTSIASVTPTGNPATVTKTGNGNATITATLIRCDGTYSTSKTIVTGVPDNSTFKIYQDPYCNGGRISFGAYSGSTFDNCSLWNMGVTNITWDILSYCCSFQITNNSGPGVCANGYNNSGIQVYFNNTYIYNAPYIRYKAQNACGWSDWMLRPVPVSFQACGSWSFSATPNPASSSLNVELNEDEQAIKTGNSTTIQEIQITDKLGNVIKQFKYATKTSKVTLDISMLKQDVYFIGVYNGKEWKTESISKQ